MHGIDHDPRSEPDPCTVALVAHASRLSAACDLGLINASEIPNHEFMWVLHYRNARDDKRAKDRPGKGTQPGANVKRYSGTKGWRAFKRMAEQARKEAGVTPRQEAG